MFDVRAGVVNEAPVATGVPPVAVVYQLKVAPAVVEVAVKVAVCPAVTCAFDGLTVTTGWAGVGLTFTEAAALVGLTQLPNDAST